MQATASEIQSIVHASQDLLLGNYNRQAIAFTHGHGATLWDVAGREYIDFCAGLATNSLGYGDTPVARAIAAQAQKLIHISNLYEVPEQIQLAEKLRAFTGYARYFFCNSGTEANEALIKLARAWGTPQGKSRIIVARNGFHGRTLGALSATAQPGLQDPFAPLLPGFDVVDFGEMASIERALGPETVAVYLEPVQAEGGGNFPPEAYLQTVRELCNQHGALMLLDEVQLGIGRSGYALAQDYYSVQADAVALAKGLGGGMPIGALAITEKLASVLGPGSHGSTFGGNPLACMAAAAVIDALSAPGMLEQIRQKGLRLLAGIEKLGGPWVQQPRGLGLFACFNTRDPAAVVKATREQGLLTVAAKNNTVRLLPPLTIRDQELDAGLDKLAAAILELGS